MAKIIIELSDGYIRERADLENLKQFVTSGKSPESALADFITFGALEKEVAKGINEFHISSATYMEKDTRELFNSAVAMAGAIVLIGNKED